MARRFGKPTVFVDTQPLLASLSTYDQHHEISIAYLRGYAESFTPIATSEWVLTEFLSGASKPPFRSAAAKVVDTLIESSLVTIVRANRADWKDGLALYSDRDDKEWSLVDCISILICRRLRIRNVLTHDHHFTQAGFEILIP